MTRRFQFSLSRLQVALGLAVVAIICFLAVVLTPERLGLSGNIGCLFGATALGAAAGVVSKQTLCDTIIAFVLAYLVLLIMWILSIV